MAPRAPRPSDELPRFGTLLAITVTLLVLLSLAGHQGGEQTTKTIPYSEYQADLAKGQLDNIVVGDGEITGDYKSPASGAPTQFVTERVDAGLAADLAKAGVTFSGAPAPGFLAQLLGWLAPLLFFGLLWFVMLGGRMGGGAGGMLSVGKSKARVYAESDIKVRFADVAGVDEAKEELKEVVDFLKDPRAYGRLGAHIPKGILLVGPPGTGKTLLARAVAGEAGVQFFSISGSEFVEMFVGVGAARVRDLFEQARKAAPAIIFIDELDSLGRARNAGYPGGGNDEKEQTLNQLLAEMDGFDPSIGVVLLAATNRPEILDPALLRAGRFDRQVLVDRPDKAGRVQILKLHMHKVKLEPGISAEEIASMTPGFSGADLANLVNEAALLATRRQGQNVTLDDFSNAVERIIAGLEKRTRLLVPKERETVAHHEMGHAITAMALPEADQVQKISIIPHGMAALGYTIQRPGQDRFLMSRSEILDRMTVLLGGRAAESLVFPEVSTGASDDLMRATDLARAMVVRYGMDPILGQMTYEPETPHLLGAAPEWRPRQYSEQTAAAIDAAIRALVEAAYTRARAILTANMALLREGAANLLHDETLSGDKLEALAAKVPAWHDEP
jgi:cell division protease FtsH